MAEKESGPGHNSGVAADELRAFIERVERIEEEIAEHREDRKELYAEIKGRGYDTAAVRKLVQLRKKEPMKRQEEAAILNLYGAALGMDIFG